MVALKGAGTFIHHRVHFSLKNSAGSLEKPFFLSLFQLPTLMINLYETASGLVVRVPGYRSRGLGSIPSLPDFLRSSGSETGSIQPHEYN
jgi:hypothetical protein